ncbi:dihydroorotate dehydrogenase electron transfer subunit [Candidatus Woesearchaeota archaeon]|nr:dihydroorotate dehydrogenase electron transfer subunit [Candidatus Woesearchaeota archaeon]
MTHDRPTFEFPTRSRTGEVPRMLPVRKVADEAQGMRTLFFSYPLDAAPGQFVMLWLPGVDQKPISVSYQDGALFGITVAEVGPFTRRLLQLKSGDLVGVTGPYGTPFTLDRKRPRAILVGGGCGAAPLGLLAERAAAEGIAVDLIIGAQTERALLFRERFARRRRITTHLATDDGSVGHAGFATDVLARLLDGTDPSDTRVYTCGPEAMMRTVAQLCAARDVPGQVLMERYMKCGFGVCGQCCIDGSGKRVCVEGPALSFGEILAHAEFGKYSRDASGHPVRKGQRGCETR